MTSHRLGRKALASAPLLSLLLTALGACSSAPEVDPSSQESEAILRPCTADSCPSVNSCADACDGTKCMNVKVGALTCPCFGPCSAGLDCISGRCQTPPKPIAPIGPVCAGSPPEYQTWWVPGAKEIEFRQLAPGEAPSPDTQCYSGCGPTAWAMFFAQMDTKWRLLGHPDWTTNPPWFQAPVKDANTVTWGGNYAQITMDISHHLGTSCSAPFGSGAYTEPTWMASVADYVNQGPESQYNPHGPLGGYAASGFAYQYDTHNTDDSLAPDYLNDYGTLDYARDWIINYGYPVVYGYFPSAGSAHYGLATGYREKATAWSCQGPNGGQGQWVITKSDNTQWQFYINGGAGDTDDWRSPAAYYVGTIKIFQQ